MDSYSNREAGNWANSKSIVLYENEEQFKKFVGEALANKDLQQKLYFGKLGNAVSDRIKNETGVGIKGYNLTLRKSEIKKIIQYSHGNEVREALRGQRAVTLDDLLYIPEIIASADTIARKTDYENKPVLEFKKNIDNKHTVTAYVSAKHNDLSVQTMYINVKRSLAVAADDHASANTSKTNNGTAPNTNIPQNTPAVNTQSKKSETKAYVPEAEADTAAQEYREAAVELGRQMGVKVKYVPEIKGGRMNGMYKDGTIYIAEDTTDPIGAVFSHEAIHYLRKTAPTAYRDYYKAVMDVLTEENAASGETDEQIRGRLIREVREAYSEAGVELGANDAVEELAADFAARLMNTPEEAARLIAEGKNLSAAQKRSVLQRLADALKHIWERVTAIVRRGGSDRAEANLDRLDRARRALVEMLAESDGKTDASSRAGVKYTVGRDEGGEYINIDRDILAGVPEKDWGKTVKRVLKDKFSNGIDYNGEIVAVTAKSRGEFTNSSQTRSMSKQDRSDKFRMANNLDEIVNNQSYEQTEPPTHTRRDDIVGFDRGHINIKIGNREFTADVLLGRKNDGSRMFYDISNLKRRPSSPHMGRQTADTIAGGTGTTLPTNNVSQNGPAVNTQNENGGEKFSVKDGDHKQKQLDIIEKFNPAWTDNLTWIRSVDDIQTFEEALNDPYSGYEQGEDFDPSYSWDMAMRALDGGKITVYSSHPIEQGAFVTPSRMEARDYAGGGKVYSKVVPLEDVAWIDPTQGQYAKVDDGEKFSVQRNITQSDVQAIQSIGRKSINDFDEADRRKTEAVAEKYYREMGVKSPFFRAWFGDWRAGDQTSVHVVTEKGAVRGVNKNRDTGWNIQVSGKVFNETKAHKQSYNIGARPYLEYINSIVENAVLLDSYAIPESKAKSQNSVMMHSFYAIVNNGDGFDLLKLYVEEMYNPNTKGTDKRSYQLQNIAKRQLSDRVQDKSLAPSASTADSYSVADLFRLVKSVDKNFSGKDASKVVNDDGTPKVVYHGTDAEFNVFDTKRQGQNYRQSKPGYKGGFFFTSDRQSAQNYAELAGGNRVVEGYLNIKNPLEINAPSALRPADYYDMHADDIMRQADRDGHDGVIIKGTRDNLYIAFDPEQIKSVDNSGTFDPSNEDIRYSLKRNAGGDMFRADETAEKKYGKQIDGWLSGEMPSNGVFELGKTPGIYQELGAQSLPVIMPQEVLAKVTGGKHSISLDEIKKLPSAMADPIMIFNSATVPNAYLALTELTDKAGNSVVLAMHLNRSEKHIRVNRIASVYGKNNLAGFISRQVEDGNLRYIDKEKSEVWPQSRGLQLPKLADTITRSNSSILQKSDFVNTQDGSFSLKKNATADEVKAAWVEAKEKYGTYEAGETPVRESAAPRKISDKEYLSAYARTMIEAGVTPDWAVSEFEKMIADGTLTHETITDESARKRAEAVIKYRGFDEALKYWQSRTDEGNINKNSFALGQLLYNEAVTAAQEARERNDVEAAERATRDAMRLAADLVVEATTAGQTLQATRMLKRMTPDGQLYYMEKSVKKLNEEFRERLGDRFKDIELDEELMEQYLTAKDEDERNNLYDRICQDIADQVPSTARDKWNAWRYLAMLGNPRTHTRNVVGNAIFYPVVKVKNAVARTVEPIAQTVGAVKKDERTQTWKRVPKEVKDFAKNDFAKMRDTLQGVNAKYALTSDIESRRRIFKTGWLEALRKLNNGALESEDMMFLKLHYTQSLAKAITARGYGVDFLSGGTKEAVKALESVRKYAVQEAQRATYRDANVLASALTKIQRRANNSRSWAVRSAGAMMEGVIPFKKTPLNIAKQGILYSPLGIFDFIHKCRSSNATGADVVDSLARTLTGTGIVLVAMALKSLGMVSGAGDDNEKKRKFDEMTGEQDYALKIGDDSYTVDWAAPVSLPFFVGVALGEYIEDGEFTFKEAVDALTNISEPMFELSVLQGLSDTIKSASYSKTNPIFTVSSQMAENYLSQALPTLGGQLARSIDDVRRKNYVDKDSQTPEALQKFIQQAAKKIPGATMMLEPDIDMWGREKTYGEVGERIFENFLSPGYYEKENKTALDRELENLFKATGDTAVFPASAQKYFTVNGERVNLGAKEYTGYAKMLGQKRYTRAMEIIRSQKYKNADDAARVKLLKKAYEKARDEAKEEMLKKIGSDKTAG